MGPVAIALGLWLAVAVVYWPSSWALGRLWISADEETYTHGFLILLISLWLVIRERRRLAASPIRPVPQALIALLLLSALWTWAWRAAIQELHTLLVPLILLTAILSVLGSRAARLLAFPAGYLYFAFPFWSDGNFILESLSARMTGALMWLTGVPGFMHGNFIELPGGAIHIANGCSGLHAFIVGLALAALYAKVFDLPLRRRWGAVALMGALALMVNWLRIFIVAAVAYDTDMRSPLLHHHWWLGWWLFAAAFAGFLWWMERKPLAPTSPSLAQQVPKVAVQAEATNAVRTRPWIGLARTVATVIALALALVLLVAFATGFRSSLARAHYWFGLAVCAAALAGILWWVGRKRRPPEASAIRGGAATQPHSALVSSGIGAAQVVAALVSMAILPLAAYGLDWAHAHDSVAVIIHWPTPPNGWAGPARSNASQWAPYFVGAGGESLRAYTNARGQEVQAFAVAYRIQTQHAKLLGYWNRLLGRTSPLRRESQHIVDSVAGRWIETRVIAGSGTRSLVWSRYQVGSRVFVNPRLSQAWYGLAALVDPPLSSLTAFRALCQPSCSDARARLTDVAQKVRPTFSEP
jgi:exosortase